MTTPTDNPTHPAAGEELKPCPFCGDAPEIERVGTARRSMIVACANCGCRLESGDVSAPRAWNTRAESPDLTAERQKREAVEKRIAAINGQRNIMANAINAQDFVRYWAADEEIGKLVAGDYDHDLASKFATLTADRDTLKARVAELERELSGLQELLAAVKEAKQEIYTEKQQARFEAENAKAKAVRLEADLATLRQELEAAKKELSDWKKTAKFVDNDHADTLKQLADSTARVEALTKALDVWYDHFFWRQSPDERGEHLVHDRVIQRCLKVAKAALTASARISEGATPEAIGRMLHTLPAIDPQPADAGAESAKAATGWLPIETAPKDGTKIVGWGKLSYKEPEGPYVTQWKDYGEGSIAHAQWREGKGPKGTFWHTEPINNWTNGWKPTHWMPLPATPPETTEVRAVEPQAEQAESEGPHEIECPKCKRVRRGTFGKEGLMCKECNPFHEIFAKSPTAIAPGHNPDKLTNEQVETEKGWRLITQEEFEHFVKVQCLRRGVQRWWHINQGWGSEPTFGDSSVQTYRRRVTPSEGKGAK